MPDYQERQKGLNASVILAISIALKKVHNWGGVLTTLESLWGLGSDLGIGDHKFSPKWERTLAVAVGAF